MQSLHSAANPSGESPGAGRPSGDRLPVRCHEAHLARRKSLSASRQLKLQATHTKNARVGAHTTRAAVPGPTPVHRPCLSAKFRLWIRIPMAYPMRRQVSGLNCTGMCFAFGGHCDAARPAFEQLKPRRVHLRDSQEQSSRPSCTSSAASSVRGARVGIAFSVVLFCEEVAPCQAALPRQLALGVDRCDGRPTSLIRRCRRAGPPLHRGLAGLDRRAHQPHPLLVDIPLHKLVSVGAV